MNEKYTKNTVKSRTDLKRLKQKSDKDIDYTDIPETDEKFWDDASVVMPHKKVHLSVRFDDDVVRYFKRAGRGYQSRMNAVLRGYVERSKKKKRA